MNHYSELILNNIIDYSPLDTMLDEVDEIYGNTGLLLMYYARRVISFEYIQRLIDDRSVKYAYRTIGTDFDFSNIPSIMAYAKTTCDNEIHYYILLICTKQKYKNMGYASALLDDFIAHIKNTNKSDLPVKIILSSVVESVTYYEKYGFKWTRKNLTEYPFLLNYESHEPDKEYFMMELSIC